MTTPADRGDLAESLVPVAAELAFLVRTESREAIGEWLGAHGINEDEARALMVVLAAMIPIDATNDDNLSWLTFDEHGAPLEQTIPLLPVLPVPSAGAVSPALPQPAAGEAIRQARTRAGLSQRALAAEAGVGHRTLRGWEAGERPVSQGNWVMLQVVLGPLGVVRDPGPDAGKEQRRGEADAA